MLQSFINKISSSLGLTNEELKKAIVLPVLLLVMVSVADIIGRAIGFPDVKETIELIKSSFMNYGYPLVFFAAFVETLLLIGLYIPGSVAMILAASLAGQGLLNIWIVIFMVVLGCLLAIIVNYLLGRFGWYHLLTRFGLSGAIDKTKIKAEKNGIKYIHLTYLNPNLASLTATSFGILRINFFKFLIHSIVALIYWNTLWGISFYLLGNWVENYINYKSLITLIVFIIAVRVLYIIIKKKIGIK